MSSSNKSQSQDFNLTRRTVYSIAAYVQPDGSLDYVPLTGPVDPNRKLAFEVMAAQPTYEFGVQIGKEVIWLGIQWPNAPQQNWQERGARVARQRYEQREREARDEQRRKAVQKARKELARAEANPRDDASFNFAAPDTFTTPNHYVALKAIKQGRNFLDAVRDANGDLWYRFSDPDGVSRDALCPSCGDENIVDISDGGVPYRMCHGCSFRWAREVPSSCPVCHQHDKFSTIVDGRDVYLKCCFFKQKLGNLPRVPASAREAERIAVGVDDVEDHVET